MGRGLMADNKDMSMMQQQNNHHHRFPPSPSSSASSSASSSPSSSSSDSPILPSKRKLPDLHAPLLPPRTKFPKLVLKVPHPSFPPPQIPPHLHRHNQQQQQQSPTLPQQPPLTRPTRPPTFDLPKHLKSHAFQHTEQFSVPSPHSSAKIRPLRLEIKPQYPTLNSNQARVEANLVQKGSDSSNSELYPKPQRLLTHPNQQEKQAKQPNSSNNVQKPHQHLHGLPSPHQISVKKLSQSPNQEGPSHGSHHSPRISSLHHTPSCHNLASRSGSLQSSPRPSPSSISPEYQNHSKSRNTIPDTEDHASNHNLSEQQENHLLQHTTQSAQIPVREKEASQPQFSEDSSPKVPDVNDGQPSLPIPGKKTLRGVLDKLQKKDKYAVFARPVDKEEVPNYYDIIKDPMDFGTIRKRISSDYYTSLNTFQKDIFLICDNAMKFNARGTIYYRHARAIKDAAERILMDLRKLGYTPEVKEIVARYKTGKKSHKKKVYATVGMDRTSGSSAVGRDLGGAETPGRLLEKHGSNVYTGSPNEVTLDDTSGYLLRSTGSINEWRRYSTYDENPRSTYKPPSIPAQGSDSLLTMISGDSLHVVPIAYQINFLYAKSLARFATGLGPYVWKIAAEKIRRTLPPAIPFGPGWIGEREAPAGIHQAKQQMQNQANGKTNETRSLNRRNLHDSNQQHNLLPRSQHIVKSVDLNETVGMVKEQETVTNNKIADNNNPKLVKQVNLNQPASFPSENTRSSENSSNLVRSLSTQKNSENDRGAAFEKKLADSTQVNSSLSCQKSQVKYAPNLNLPAQHAQEIDCSEWAQNCKEQNRNMNGLEGPDHDIVITGVGKNATHQMQNWNGENHKQVSSSGNQSHAMSSISVSALHSGPLTTGSENQRNSGRQSVDPKELVAVDVSGDMSQQKCSDKLQRTSSSLQVHSAQLQGSNSQMLPGHLQGNSSQGKLPSSSSQGHSNHLQGSSSQGNSNNLQGSNSQGHPGHLQGSSAQGHSGHLQGNGSQVHLQESSSQEHSGHLQGSNLQIHSAQVHRSSLSSPQINFSPLQGSFSSSTQSYSEIVHSRLSSLDQQALPNGRIIHVSHPLQQQELSNIWYSNNTCRESKSVSHQSLMGAGIPGSTNINFQGLDRQNGLQGPKLFPEAPDLNVSLSALKAPFDQSSVSETQQPDLALQL